MNVGKRDRSCYPECIDKRSTPWCLTESPLYISLPCFLPQKASCLDAIERLPWWLALARRGETLAESQRRWRPSLQSYLRLALSLDPDTRPCQSGPLHMILLPHSGDCSSDLGVVVVLLFLPPGYLQFPYILFQTRFEVCSYLCNPFPAETLKH